MVRRPSLPTRWSVAHRLLALQAVVLVLVVALATGLAYLDARRDANDSARRTTMSVARAVADSPAVREALALPDPSTELEPLAERIRRDTDTDFVVVMAPDRTRYSHPNPAEIGRDYIGTIAPALRGETFSETYRGTLGPSVRTITPVMDDDGHVVALVAVGITVKQVGSELSRQLPVLLGAGAAVLVVAVLGTLLVSRRIDRFTYGLGPEQLGRMYGYYDAVLHSVREGLVLLDREGKVQMVNDEARSLLALPDDVVGRTPAELGLPPAFAALLASDEQVRDEIHLTGDRVVVVNASAAMAGARQLGRVVTLRDHTELQALSGELDAARGLADALRSQAHESANRLHTVVSLVEIGRPEEAVEFAIGELQSAQALTDRVVAAVDDPVVAALLLGKSAAAAERGVELVIAADTDLDSRALEDVGASPRDLVTVLGNLVDNAIDAVADQPAGEGAARRVEVEMRPEEGGLLLCVADTGPGMSPDVAAHAFERGWSTKAADPERLHGRGLGLALVGQTIARLGGTVGVETASQDGGARFVVRLPGRARERA